MHTKFEQEDLEAINKEIFGVKPHKDDILTHLDYWHTKAVKTRPSWLKALFARVKVHVYNFLHNKFGYRTNRFMYKYWENVEIVRHYNLFKDNPEITLEDEFGLPRS